MMLKPNLIFQLHSQALAAVQLGAITIHKEKAF